MGHQTIEDTNDSTMLSREYGVSVWGSPSWLADATQWLDQHLAAAGIARTGDVTQPHLRPWATALNAPTTAGLVWLKAAAPGTAFETRLYATLAGGGHRHVLRPLAIDHERAWFLLPDGGPVLGDILEGAELLRGLTAALPYYGQLQLDLAGSSDELIAAGVRDARPAELPAQLAEALETVGEYVARAGSRVDRTTYKKLSTLGPEYADRCAALSGGPVPASLEHGDLHPGNIFAAHHDTAPVFFDWGDSTVGHPFASMLVTLRVVGSRSGSDETALRVARDAYLEPFTSLAPRHELVQALEEVCHIGKVSRALSWARALMTLPGEDVSEYADAPLRWLGYLLDDSYLGTYD